MTTAALKGLFHKEERAPPKFDFSRPHNKGYDYIAKVAVIGDPNCGKTSLLNQYCHHIFKTQYITTIGSNFESHQVDVLYDGEKKGVMLQVWDLAGQDYFDSVRPLFYAGTMACILVADRTEPKTFEHLPEWVDEMYDGNHVAPVIPTILVGNKSDLHRNVTAAQIGACVGEITAAHPGYKNIPYVETSAKTGENVDYVFTTLTTMFLNTVETKSC